MNPQAQSTEEQSRLPHGEHKVPTRISGLDNILAGGVPKGALTLLRGGPGTGKTMLGLEFVYRGALAGRPGVFLSFEERETALRRYAQNLGWDLESLEKQGLLILIGAHRSDTTNTLSGSPPPAFASFPSPRPTSSTAASGSRSPQGSLIWTHFWKAATARPPARYSPGGPAQARPPLPALLPTTSLHKVNGSCTLISKSLGKL